MSYIPPVAKAVGRATGSVFQKIGRAMARPAVPELVHRGTAEAPTLLQEAIERGTGITERAPDVPYHGDPELRAATRATEAPKKMTVVDGIQAGKEVLGSFFRADPNLAKDVQKILVRGRWRGASSQHIADRVFREVYAPLTDRPVEKTALMHDYLIAADEVAQALRQGRDVAMDKPLAQVMDHMSKLEQLVSNDPEIDQAIANRRDLWDNIFNDMIARGWSVPEHYLEDYTPIRKLRAIHDGLATQSGENLKVKKLSAEYHRTNAAGDRETNLLSLEHELIGKYFRKVAEHEAFTELISDKTIDLTHKFKVQDKLPLGLRIYRPGAGMIGYMRKPPIDDVIGGMIEELDMPKDVLQPGDYVFAEPLTRALEHYHQGHAASRLENTFRTAGRTLARWWTVYNPANTRLNMASDLILAMHGLPGEAAHPVGILKWYPTALKAAYKGAFEKGKSFVKIGDQTVDLWELVENAGLAESTLLHQVQGQKMSGDLMRLIPETMQKQQFILFDVMQRDRLGTELAPRIAAGLEAWERTGNISEFGRVGREITLHYGAGAPLASRMPIVRILSPFIQYIGLASGRVFDLLKAPESRVRTVASMMAVPTVTWMWNNQNDEYRKVEDALPDYMRDQAHVTAPDPLDPSKPRYDTVGRPLVIPFRFSVPEEVMKMAGLGNIVSRIHRGVRGRQTPGELGKDVVSRAAKTAVETFTLTPGFLKEFVSGKTSTGQEIKLPDRITRLLPGARPLVEGVRDAELVGPKEAALRAGLTVAGMRPANVMRRGDVLSDVDIVTARRKVSEAKSRLRRAILNEGPSAVKDAEKKFDEAVAGVERIADAMEREEANAKRTK